MVIPRPMIPRRATPVQIHARKVKNNHILYKETIVEILSPGEAIVIYS
jgi:hypothetical protein